MAATTKLTVYNDVLTELGIKYRLQDVVTTNARLTALEGSFNHAVEYMLAQTHWNFARRRATLTFSSSSAFPPYTFTASKPSDWLKTCWIKLNANDDMEANYADSAAAFYSFTDDALIIEYVSDHADNYDPANWSPHFTRAFVAYLAFLVAPGLARAGDDASNKLYSVFERSLEIAVEEEARHLANVNIPADRHGVMRLALSFLGQELGSNVQVRNHRGKLTWEMSQHWDHAVKYCLEQGAWNFASRRARLVTGSEQIPGDEWDTIIEGYSLGSVEDDDESTVPLSEYTYGYTMPSDFVHKIWLKADPSDMLECDHQFLKDLVMTNVEPVILEYVSNDTDAVDPDNWTATFTEAVAAYLSALTVPELYLRAEGRGMRETMFEAKENMMKLFQAKLGDAKRKDAIQQQAKPMPLGRFARARMGGRGYNGLSRYRN
jgi:hypothetical protein